MNLTKFSDTAADWVKERKLCSKISPNDCETEIREIAAVLHSKNYVPKIPYPCLKKTDSLITKLLDCQVVFLIASQ